MQRSISIAAVLGAVIIAVALVYHGRQLAEVSRRLEAMERRTTGLDSRLEQLMGHAARGGRLPVNSRHHQAVGRIAAGFVVTSLAPDGVIEALELPHARFCVGVQWHPENFVESGTFLPLFAGLVAAART